MILQGLTELCGVRDLKYFRECYITPALEMGQQSASPGVAQTPKTETWSHRKGKSMERKFKMKFKEMDTIKPYQEIEANLANTMAK